MKAHFPKLCKGKQQTSGKTVKLFKRTEAVTDLLPDPVPEEGPTERPARILQVWEMEEE